MVEDEGTIPAATSQSNVGRVLYTDDFVSWGRGREDERLTVVLKKETTSCSVDNL